MNPIGESGGWPSCWRCVLSFVQALRARRRTLLGEDGRPSGRANTYPVSGCPALGWWARTWPQSKTAPAGRFVFSHAFVREDGKMTDLGALGGKESQATAINERGQIIRGSTTETGQPHAVLWALHSG